MGVLSFFNWYLRVEWARLLDISCMLVLKLLAARGLRMALNDTTFFLGKSTIARAERHGLFTWRRELFRHMQRNAPSAAEYFNLPPDRVVELGTQLRL